ncbi:hypothetical protein Pla123a_27850 [Posidoniimonas polymericola]|uniref:Uncharacterized protein n=1 Tax=Posidoniimonas polymericola TaxID=2528002 RepID=A0A5C5YME2_9BACT|nr:hypothetical protein [Posidoniimonas polymericola]TWT75999.1 hypothetical protein Pla123a_27850 [Posidoniimonas polymericola]
MNALILAQRANWERMGDRFSGEAAELQTEELLTLLAVVVGAGLLIWLLRVAARWQEGRLKRPNPRRLFNDLCRAHRLNRWERKLLREMGEGLGLRQPAEVFVRPDAFRASPLPPDAEAMPVAFKQLQKKLFAELSPH